MIATSFKMTFPKSKPREKFYGDMKNLNRDEITDKLLRTTDHMNNFCIWEFVFMFFQPNKFK